MHSHLQCFPWNNVKIKWALLSTSDKTGIVELAMGLTELGIKWLRGGECNLSSASECSSFGSSLPHHRLPDDEAQGHRFFQQEGCHEARRGARCCHGWRVALAHFSALGTFALPKSLISNCSQNLGFVTTNLEATPSAINSSNFGWCFGVSPMLGFYGITSRWSKSPLAFR